jgi:pyrroline-5-carboxylate reductase
MTAAGLGIVGVGAIAEAIVVGLCEPPAAPPSIVLSPRNPARAGALADRFPSVRVAADNQAAVSDAELVLVCVRPQDAAAALSGLTFPPDTAVISVMAGVSLEEVGRLVAPAPVLARAVPLPAVARRRGLTAVFPGHPRALDLFDPLGGTVVAQDESGLDALSAATATIAAHLAQLVTIRDWVAGRGVAEADATRFVAEVFAGVAEPLRAPGLDLAAMADEFATPGGLNEQFLAALRGAGVPEVVRRGLDEVAARLVGP